MLVFNINLQKMDERITRETSSPSAEPPPQDKANIATETMVHLKNLWKRLNRGRQTTSEIGRSEAKNKQAMKNLETIGSLNSHFTNLLRLLTELIQPSGTNSKSNYVLLSAFPTDPASSSLRAEDPLLSQVLSQIKLAIQRVVSPSTAHDIALFDRKISELIRLSEPGKTRNLQLLGQVSREQTQKVTANVKTQIAHLTVFLAAIILMSVGIVKMLTFDIGLLTFISGSALIGAFLYSVMTTNEFGLSTGDIVHIALIFLLYQVWFWRKIPLDGPEDRGVIMATCIFAIAINYVVQMGSTASSIFDSVFKLAFLTFNLKVDCTILEFAVQLFLFLFLTINKSGMYSIEDYQEAYLQHYRETIQSNQRLREITMQSLCNAISAIQIIVEQSKSGEIIDLQAANKPQVNPHTIPFASISTVQNLKIIAQLASFFDTISRHQFHELEGKSVMGSSERQAQLTHAVLSYNKIHCVKTIGYVKNALITFRNLSKQNEIITSMFLIEPQNAVPIKIFLNREIVSALLNSVLQLALATTKTKGVSIYISWKPRNANQQASKIDRHYTSVDPIYVQDYRFRERSAENKLLEGLMRTEEQKNDRSQKNIKTVGEFAPQTTQLANQKYTEKQKADKTELKTFSLSSIPKNEQSGDQRSKQSQSNITDQSKDRYFKNSKTEPHSNIRINQPEESKLEERKPKRSPSVKRVNSADYKTWPENKKVIKNPRAISLESILEKLDKSSKIVESTHRKPEDSAMSSNKPPQNLSVASVLVSKPELKQLIIQTSNLSQVEEQSKELNMSAESLELSPKKPEEAGIAVESVKSIIASVGSQKSINLPKSDALPPDSTLKEVLNQAQIISNNGLNDRCISAKKIGFKKVEEEKKMDPNQLDANKVKMVNTQSREKQKADQSNPEAQQIVHLDHLTKRKEAKAQQRANREGDIQSNFRESHQNSAHQLQQKLRQAHERDSSSIQRDHQMHGQSVEESKIQANEVEPQTQENAEQQDATSSNERRVKLNRSKELDVIPEEQIEPRSNQIAEEKKPAQSKQTGQVTKNNFHRHNESEQIYTEKQCQQQMSSDSQKDLSGGSKQDVSDQKYQFTFKASSNENSSGNDAKQMSRSENPGNTSNQRLNGNNQQARKGESPKVLLEVLPQKQRSKSINQEEKTEEQIHKLNKHAAGLRHHRGSISLGSIEEEEKSVSRSKSEGKDVIRTLSSQINQSYAKEQIGSFTQRNNPHFQYQFGFLCNSKNGEQPLTPNKVKSEIEEFSKAQPKPESNLAPVKPIVIDNFGHNRRSNLKSKAEEIQRVKEQSSQSQQNEVQKSKPTIKQAKQQEQSDRKNEKNNRESQYDYEGAIKKLQERQDYSQDDSSSSNFLEQIEKLCGKRKPNEAIQTMLEHMRIIQQLAFDSDPSLSNQATQQSQPPSSINKPSSGKAQSERYSYKQGYSSFEENNPISCKNRILNKTDKRGIPSLDSPTPPHSLQPVKSQETKQQSIVNKSIKSKVIGDELSKDTSNQSIRYQNALNFLNHTSSSGSARFQKNQSPRSGKNNSSNERSLTPQSSPIYSFVDSSTLNFPKETFESYYAKLKSLVASRETSKEAAELVEILEEWELRNQIGSFEESPPATENIFDGILEIQVYDVKTCRLQMSKQNLNDFATQVSQRTNCGEHDCNRNQTIRLQSGTLEPQKWADILKLKSKTVVGPELELCKCIAEMLGAKVLIQQKNDKKGNQFCISVPVISNPHAKDNV